MIYKITVHSFEPKARVAFILSLEIAIQKHILLNLKQLIKMKP